MPEQNIFATLRGGGRIWAVAAIHGEAEHLAELHRQLVELIAPGDQVVYLGNYLGRGPMVRQTIDELLLFRRYAMARSGGDSDDIIFLRGAQEEMWQKLLQLQFAPNPSQVLEWMVEQGVGATIAAYGTSWQEGLAAAREGIMPLTRWTGQLRQNMRSLDGHTQLMSVLRHAAYTDDNFLLFVHAGLDPIRPLSAQSDSFWWGSNAFSAMTEPYAGFSLVVRGYDWKHGGLSVDGYAVTLDNGCGYDGPLVAACFDPEGRILKMIQG
ncbi:MAG: hypothetical protein K2Q10_11375 [Rhodospirillales bacterium]|nr:hypothetical protein [Rhodospirillales bacterium]